MVFAWSMQFIVIEWRVYSMTKNPLSLGIIGLMEVIPAVSMVLFVGHIVDQKEKKSLLFKCLLGFSVIGIGLFLLTWPKIISRYESGLTAKFVGTLTAVVFGGTMTMITVFSTGVLFPKFRKLNLQTDIDNHDKNNAS